MPPGATLKMLDAHCHFSSALVGTWFRPDHVYLLNATDPTQFEDLAEFRRIHPLSVRVGYGVHPYYLHMHPDLAATLAEVRARLAADQTAFVGEIGLDTRPAALADSPLDTQTRYFSPQLEMAFEMNRDCNVHIISRKPGLWPIFTEQLEAMARKYASYNRSIIMHSYNGTHETFRKLQAAVSTCHGRVLLSVSHFTEANKATRACIRRSDKECLLLETDWYREDQDDWDRSMATAIEVLASERSLSRDEALSLVRDNWRRHELLPPGLSAAQLGM
ncbi:Putative DNase, TatD family protein [Giardia duodenalis]|uniref:Putative DNase, TatD family protein n=1 Tax=Giardia intestinalis TaxID=5741 RepID=V6T9M5_GIAIN|nr:Putative DNase, TatD family protein [Giardia intestinalis]